MIDIDKDENLSHNLKSSFTFEKKKSKKKIKISAVNTLFCIFFFNNKKKFSARASILSAATRTSTEGTQTKARRCGARRSPSTVRVPPPVSRQVARITVLIGRWTFPYWALGQMLRNTGHLRKPEGAPYSTPCPRRFCRCSLSRFQRKPCWTPGGRTFRGEIGCCRGPRCNIIRTV